MPLFCQSIKVDTGAFSMKENYKIEKLFNNNVILAQNLLTDREVVLVGKGVGFAKKIGKDYYIAPKEIDKEYAYLDESIKSDYFSLVQQLDEKVIGVTEEIIARAEAELGELNQHIHIMLADHIGFAIERLRDGMIINNPFLYEIQILYKKEYELAEYAYFMIKEHLAVEIPDAEKGFIAMHLHSAQKNTEIKQTVKNARILNDIVECIEQGIGKSIPRGDLAYTRLVHHISASLSRMDSQKMIVNPLLKSIKKDMKISYKIAQEVADRIKHEKEIHVTEDEIGFLAIHIERIKNL